MKSVLISIQPKWVEKIANGKKTIEVRKTAPKEVPFKAYIYCTKEKKQDDIIWAGVCGDRGKWNGRVIGEFVCDKVFLLHPYTYDRGSADLERRKLIQTFEGSSKENEILATTCLTQDEMFDYIGAGNYGYGWHISDLKIYGNTKELSEFYSRFNIPENKCKCCDNCFWKDNGYGKYYAVKKLTREPQSWQYVEEQKNDKEN